MPSEPFFPQALADYIGALPEVEDNSELTVSISEAKLNFNGTLTGALQDPMVSGRAELGSLIMNGRDLGSLTPT
jgi:hypothetical protein